MLAWLGTGLASLLVVATKLWCWYRSQRKQAVAHIVNAITAEDLTEFSILLLERTDLKSVTEWFGDSALIIAVKSIRTACGADFTVKALKLPLAHGDGH